MEDLWQTKIGFSVDDDYCNYMVAWDSRGSKRWLGLRLADGIE